MSSTEPTYRDDVRFAARTRDEWYSINMAPVRSLKHYYPWAFKNREAQRKFGYYAALQAQNRHRVVIQEVSGLICSCGLVCSSRDIAETYGHLYEGGVVTEFMVGQINEENTGITWRWHGESQ